MSQTRSLKTFIIKSAIMLVLLGLPIYLLGLVPGMQAVTDPRKFLFKQKEFSGFNYAIIGDSVFCSYLVDSIDDTMWSRFNALTGQQLFPGALNGATIADMVDASEYLSTQLPDGATVFVGLIPTRFVGKGIVRHRNYFNEFDQLKKAREASYIKHAATTVIDLAFGDFLLYREPYSFEKFLRKKKGDFDTGHKTWDKAAWERAITQYRTFVETQKRLETHIDYVALEQIRENLSAKNIQTVFVLSALNQGLINEFSEPEEAATLIEKFRTTKNELIDYFNRSQMEYIDLFDKMNTECFADLVHQNTCGDEVMAKAFAIYIAQENNGGE